MSAVMRFSPSSLGKFKDCPRCFWIKQNLGVDVPRGIMASIMGGIDKVMKAYSAEQLADQADVCYLIGIEGARPFADRARLKSFSNWRVFQTTVQCGKHLITFSGELDELIEFPDGRVAAWDFKSNGRQRDYVEYTALYNQTQGDMYDVLLTGQGLKTVGAAYFTYTWPVAVKSDGSILFGHETVAMQTDAERVMKIAEDAVDCLKGPIPAPSMKCEYCTYVGKYAQAMQALPVDDAVMELPMGDAEEVAPAVAQAPAPKRRKGKL